MGAWSVSITGNDTAADLLYDYPVVFFRNDVEIALAKIDAFVRKNGFSESNAEEWCNYYYSLANYMWSKGILTDTVKAETLRMIDSGFGLDLWEEAGSKTLTKRKKALATFRDKIISPQTPKKKIKLGYHTTPVFEIGDVIAFQLQTLGKRFVKPDGAYWKHKLDEEGFRALNGKYIAIRKIKDEMHPASAIEPDVKNVMPIFQLYRKVFDEIPTLEDVIDLDIATFPKGKADTFDAFLGEGSLFHFKKRKHVVLGNSKHGLTKCADRWDCTIAYTLGEHKHYCATDMRFVNAMAVI
ncbi:MAG: hypothetical protein FWB88_04470 [Defluviitaleaceae bacterium]|nr:hypothetical protein [Defluviitaleaceae bacterium]MCL2239668.1 hypothetical protein [Defluviitaleaceae bacterium]